MITNGQLIIQKHWFLYVSSSNTCHDVHNTSFHTLYHDKTGDGVSVFIIRNGYTSTQMFNFSKCHAYYEINTEKVSLPNICRVILKLVYTDHQANLEFPSVSIKLSVILSSNSESDLNYSWRSLNIKLLDPTAIGNAFINNWHSNCWIL